MNTRKTNSTINSLDNKIVLYTDKRGNIELFADVERDTLWATQIQMAHVFDTTLQNVNLHLIHIYKENELKKIATIKKSLIVQNEGGRSIQRPVILYNLDAIIAVGYRVNSKKATQFRIWATRILHDYLVKGYVLNQHQLSKSPESLDGLHEAISLIESKGRRGTLKGKLTLKLTKNLVP